MGKFTNRRTKADAATLFTERVPILLPIVGMMFASIFICLKISVLPENFNRFFKFVSIWFIMMLHVVPMMRKHKWMIVAPIYTLFATVATVLAGQTFENIIFALMGGLGTWALMIGYYAEVERFGKETFAKHAFWVLSIFCLLNDVSVLLSHDHSSGASYLLGSKFTVGYLHLTLLALYLYLMNKRRKADALYNRFLFLAFFAETEFILVVADSMTCFLAVLALFAMSFLPKKFMAKFSVGWLLVIITFVATLLFFSGLMLLKNPAVANFIQNTLHRSITLTGRTQIYSALSDLIKASPVYGYGYGNDIVGDVVGWGNAQNGLGSLMITFGAMGTLVFFIMICALLPRVADDVEIARAIACCYLAFILASLVEISFGAVFVLFVLLFSAIAFGDEPEPEEERNTKLKYTQKPKPEAALMIEAVEAAEAEAAAAAKAVPEEKIWRRVAAHMARPTSDHLPILTDDDIDFPPDFASEDVDFRLSNKDRPGSE